MPSPVVKSVEVVATPEFSIREYHGGASTKDTALSAAHEIVTAATNSSPWRCPEFSEYILVVAGVAHVEHGRGGAVETAVIEAGRGIVLPQGRRVRVTFPGPAEVVAICLPAFSPATEHAETEGEATPAHGTDGALTTATAVDVVKAPALTITEYFGNVTGSGGALSACVARVGAPCSEAWQRPAFAEWVLVLTGTLHLEHAAGTTVVPAGSGVFLEAGERVKWVWPEACTYVPICMPAFTPAGCRREPEEGSAKDADPATMAGLHKLHASK